MIRKIVIVVLDHRAPPRCKSVAHCVHDADFVLIFCDFSFLRSGNCNFRILFAGSTALVDGLEKSVLQSAVGATTSCKWEVSKWVDLFFGEIRPRLDNDTIIAR
jgi:hypothetical protein